MHLARPNLKIDLPVTVWVDPNDKLLWLETAIACEPWNDMRPCFNIVSERSGAFVEIIWGTSTWVDMPREDRMHSIVHVDRTWNQQLIRFWLPHELGHTINLADHVYPGTDISKYTNAAYCKYNDPNDYHGIMSYCYILDGFKEDDRQMMQKHWPTKLHKINIPMISND